MSSWPSHNTSTALLARETRNVLSKDNALIDDAYADGFEMFGGRNVTSVFVQGQLIAPPALQTSRTRPTTGTADFAHSADRAPLCAAQPGANVPAGAPTVGIPAAAAGAPAAFKQARCRDKGALP